MGTNLNNAKEARKLDKLAKELQEHSKLVTNAETGEIFALGAPAAEKAKEVTLAANAKIDNVLNELEKNSNKRPEYEDMKKQNNTHLKEK